MREDAEPGTNRRGPSRGGRTSVIIVHYNGLDMLRRCLASVLASDARDAEVIVVDNASLDRCSEALQGEFPSVRFVPSGSNLGSAGGWNVGARAASCDFLAFLNDDVVVTPGWLGPLVGRLGERDAGCACGLALFLDAPERVNSAGGMCDLLGFGQNRGIGEERGRFRAEDHPPAFYAVGSVFAVRRDLWLATGGFDGDLFMYADDLDWSWRLRLAGGDVAFEPRCIVYHKWHGSAMGLHRMAYYLERNQIRAVLKNYRAGTLLWLSPILVAVKTARAVWLAGRDRALLVSTLRAWAWNAGHLRETLRARAEVQARRVTGDRAVVRAMVLGSLEVRDALHPGAHPLTAFVGAKHASE